MKRGEIWWVNFDPAIGSEIKKTRPAVIISNDVSNQYASRVQVIPATSATRKVYPCEALITIKGKKSKVMADQIMTVSKERLYDFIGHINDSEIEDIDYILSLQLGLA
jgi:mRNA interferase MazF